MLLRFLYRKHLLNAIVDRDCIISCSSINPHNRFGWPCTPKGGMVRESLANEAVIGHYIIIGLVQWPEGLIHGALHFQNSARSAG